MNVTDCPLEEVESLTDIYNEQITQVPYCYPVTADEFGIGLRCYANDDQPDDSFHERRVLVAADGGKLIGFADVAPSYSILEELPGVQQPVLVVTGRHDHVISPRHAGEAAKRLKGSRLEILDKSGHYPHEEEPEAFLQLIYEFATQKFQ